MGGSNADKNHTLTVNSSFSRNCPGSDNRTATGSRAIIAGDRSPQIGAVGSAHPRRRGDHARAGIEVIGEVITLVGGGVRIKVIAIAGRAFNPNYQSALGLERPHCCGLYFTADAGIGSGSKAVD